MIKEAICDAHLLVLVHVRPAEEARRGLDDELGVGDRDARLRRATDTYVNSIDQIVKTIHVQLFLNVFSTLFLCSFFFSR